MCNEKKRYLSIRACGYGRREHLTVLETLYDFGDFLLSGRDQRSVANCNSGLSVLSVRQRTIIPKMLG